MVDKWGEVIEGRLAKLEADFKVMESYKKYIEDRLAVIERRCSNNELVRIDLTTHCLSKDAHREVKVERAIECCGTCMWYIAHRQASGVCPFGDCRAHSPTTAGEVRYRFPTVSFDQCCGDYKRGSCE